MNRKAVALVVFFIFVLLLAVIFVFSYISRSRIPDMQSGLITVSDEMIFGVVIGDDPRLVEKDESLLMDPEAYKKEIDLVAKLGADFVRIDINGSVTDNEERLKRLDEVVKYAEKSDLDLCFGIFGRKDWVNDSIFYGNSQGGNGDASWDDFSREYKKETKILTERYEPRYVLIFPECSDFISNQIDSERSNEEWLGLAKDIALEAKMGMIDPKVIIGGVLGRGESYSSNDQEFLRMIIENNDPIIDVISMNAYDISGLDNQIGEFMQLKEKYHWQGEIWMSEVAFFPSMVESYFDTDFDGGQEDFFLYALHLANKNDFNGFVIYNFRKGNDSLNEGVVAENYSERPAYSALEKVIED
ncbi:MAG: hypothetical protein PHI66_05305 [Candidatus Pacebacteria bacterium]|nr:hypothetical protein [Candidatus Paceibacterota bacterium]